MKKKIMEKKINYSIITLSIICMAYLLCGFLKKHEIPVELCKEITDATTEHRPYAYIFIHDPEAIANYFFPYEYYFMNHPRNPGDIAIGKSKLDEYCRDYSYLLVYGRKVKSVTHSIKSTFLDDPSPSYCDSKKKLRKWGIVEYEGDTTTSVYIYRFKRDTTLIGISGL